VRLHRLECQRNVQPTRMVIAAALGAVDALEEERTEPLSVRTRTHYDVPRVPEKHHRGIS
jgi:hypothetical protein